MKLKKGDKMNEKLIAVLLLITVVLSITSLAIVFNLNVPDVNFLKEIINSQPTQQAQVKLVVNSPSTGAR